MPPRGVRGARAFPAHHAARAARGARHGGSAYAQASMDPSRGGPLAELDRGQYAAGGEEDDADMYDDDDNRQAADPAAPRKREIAENEARYNAYTGGLARMRPALAVHPVEGDGNCLFRSVSHQVYGTDAA